MPEHHHKSRAIARGGEFHAGHLRGGDDIAGHADDEQIAQALIEPLRLLTHDAQLAAYGDMVLLF